MIRHMVFVRFRPELTELDRTALFGELGELRGRLGGISDFQTRKNLSPEGPVVHGFEDMFWFDFTDPLARDAYLEDEDHKALGARLVQSADGGLDGIFVCDIEI